MVWPKKFYSWAIFLACPAIADCINHDGSYECKCKPPAVQHGLLNCVVNASCPDACHRNAYCLQSSRDGGEVYNCTCNVGYTGDGTTNCDRMFLYKIWIFKSFFFDIHQSFSIAIFR